MTEPIDSSAGFKRRTLLQGTAGSLATGIAPFVHAQEPIVLRYLENRSTAQISQQLGVSEDAAQKRITRALGRLRKLLSRKGVSVSSAASSVRATTAW